MDLTLLIIITYFIGMFCLGIFLKKAKNSREFSTANKGLGIISISAALVMSMYGGGFVLGGAELAYQYGWFGVAYGVAAGIGMIFLGIFLSKKIYSANKEYNLQTIPSFLHRKFQNRTIALLSATLSIISLVAIASAQLFASTRIFTAMGMPIKLSLGITTLIVILIATKGMNALTNAGKYNVLIASIGAIAAIMATTSFKGITGIVPGEFEKISMGIVAWIVIPTVFYTLIGQDIHQKLYSAKNKRVMLTSCVFAGLLLCLLSIFPAIIGIQGRVLFDISPTEVVPKFILFSLPPILKGLFIAAILAAIIGCTQSVINAASTQISEDLCSPLRISEKKLNKLPSLAAIFLSLIAFLITLISTSIIDNLIIAYSLYTSGMFIPVTAAFFMKFPERRKKSIVFISLVGILTTLFFEFNFINIKMPSILPGILFSFILLFFLTLKEKTFYKEKEIKRKVDLQLKSLKNLNHKNINKRIFRGI